MNERLLHFIWQFQYYSKIELSTPAGEPVQVFFPGQYNQHQGPDFSGARIRIGAATWAGTVELHIRSSDWDKHGHQEDANYSNVILHVVWEHDKVVNTIPVLELGGRVSMLLLDRYAELMKGSVFIPCDKMIGKVNDLTWKSWKDRLMSERLLRKSADAERLLTETNGHWEEIFWRMLAGNFGVPVNRPAFEEIARSLPLSLLARHRSQIHRLEALLMGQAGLLKENVDDDYYRLLQREYLFLRGKYQLSPIHQPVHFLRMRPGNFPTVRLAQLAALLQAPDPLFSRVREAGSLNEAKKLLDVTANDYWHYHYRFGEPSPFKMKNIGDVMMHSLIINTFVPILFAYGNFHHDQRFKDKALHWLENTAPEKNNITREFEKLGVSNINALDSQALIELRNEYCNHKRCLECGIGNAILKA